ncbi:hypothetical protein CPB85DRAFT_544935 [Mucidula mucida]|nr:hypothetical protein CPB85DRAFT_544935 [Mucidula mucida]
MSASPGAHRRMEWMRKVVGTCYFIMKPWDCGELIAGYQCQDMHHARFDETQLADFYNLYGGCARDAYNATDLEPRVIRGLYCLQTNAIHHALVLQPCDACVLYESFLLSFLPLDDRKRTVWKVDSPSPHLHRRLLNKLDKNSKRAQQKWFDFHLDVSTPGSKAVAARLFDSFYHKHIIHGGSWSLRRMEPRSGNQNWRTVEEGARKFLIANKGISVADRKPWRFLRPSSVPQRTWPVDEPLSVGVYYHLTQRKASISRRHEPSGRAWLEERGIHQVTYVCVTPEQEEEEEEEEVALPLEVGSHIDGYFDCVYCMRLAYGS